MERHIPRAGEFYRHFKDRLYQIINIATESETKESLVIYQALYDDFKIYAREISNFMSKVDREKYPDIKQEYKFEQIEFENKNYDDDIYEEQENYSLPLEENNIDKPGKKSSEYLMAFIEATGYEAKKMALVLYKTKFSQIDLDCIYEILGIQNFGGNIRAQVAALVQYLDMQQQYEGERLRE